MKDNIRKKFLERLEQPPPPPEEVVRWFLVHHFSDALSADEAFNSIHRMVQINARKTRQAVVAIETLLAEPPAEGTLLKLVEIDGNVALKDATEAGARAWLRDVVKRTQEILGDDQPPPPDHQV